MEEYITEKVINLSENIPGALNVLGNLIIKKGLDSFLIICNKLEDQKITGSKIWVIYKDVGQDIEKFYDYINEK